MRIILGTDSIKAPLTGIGRYTVEVATRLLAIPEVDELLGFDFGRFHSIPERLERLAEVAEHTGNSGSGLSLIARARQAASRSPIATDMYRHLVMPISARSLKRYGDSLFHSPNFHLPSHPGPSVVTIHDLSHQLYPEYHPRARVRWMNKLVPDSLAASTRILCVSHSTRRDLEELMNVDAGKITVTYPGVGQEFKPLPTESIAATLGTYGLRANQYLLCVATLEPRKNLNMLIDCYLRLPNSIREAYPLVLIGGLGWDYESFLVKLPGLAAQGVVWLGFMPQEQLPALYNGALCFVYPSIYEGFGLPVLEAQACGTPVITSNRSSLPEVASSEALLVNTLNSDELLLALERALDDQTWRRTCSAKGLAKAAGFTWSRCARETVAVYKQAVGDTS